MLTVCSAHASGCGMWRWYVYTLFQSHCLLPKNELCLSVNLHWGSYSERMRYYCTKEGYFFKDCCWLWKISSHRNSFPICMTKIKYKNTWKLLSKLVRSKEKFGFWLCLVCCGSLCLKRNESIARQWWHTPSIQEADLCEC